MQVDAPDKIRNVAIAGHSDTGKTTLASALLYAGGVANRLNRVEDGHAVTDFDPEEQQRQISIGLATCFVPWKSHKINLLDSPGFSIFFAETRAAARAADAMILCVNGVSGIEVTTEKSWELGTELDSPLMFHLTKMDRERAEFDRVVESLRETFSRTVLPIQLPIGSEESFEGVVDLLSGRAMRYQRDGRGRGKAGDPPAEMADRIEAARTELIEAVAESDDELLEKFFEEGALSDDELREGLRKAVRERKIFPVTMSSAAHGIGPSALLDAIVEVLPDPTERGEFPATDVGGQPTRVDTRPDAPASALVFKTLSDPFTGKVSLLRAVSGEITSDTVFWNTQEESDERVGHLLAMQGKQGSEISKLVTGDIGGVAKLKAAHSGHTLCAKDRPVRLGWIEAAEPAISFAIEPKSKGDEEKIGEALTRLIEEDPSLRAHRDAETGEFLVSGAGQLHVEIAVSKLKKRFQVEVILHSPKVPYRETIRKAASGHGRHKKQTGGRGQFAECFIDIEPLADGEFEFVDEIFGGSIPQGYRPAVEKGIQESRTRGYLAGYPVVNFRVRLKDGKHHDVDSSEMAFKIAGSLAFKNAMEKAAATILEPQMKVEITTSEEFTGDIMADLSQRRGKPQGMEAKGHSQKILATVPMAEMLEYAPALDSMTQGRAHFHMEFSHYEEAPMSVRQKIIADAKKAEEES